MQENTRKTLKLYWQHTHRYRLVFFTVVFAIAGGAVINVVVPIYMKNFIDLLSAGNLDRGSVVSGLVQILIFIALLHGVEWVAWRVSSFYGAYLEAKVMEDLANTCFRYLHRLSFNFFNNSFVGSLVKRVNWFVRAYEGIADGFFWNIMTLTVRMSLMIAVVFSRNSVLGWALTGWVVCFMLINWTFTKYKLNYDLKRNAAETKASGVLADTITNHLSVKLFTGYGREMKNYAEAIGNVRKWTRISWNLDILFEAIQSFLMFSLEVGMLYLAVGFWQKGTLTVGDFVLLQAYVISMISMLWDFGRNIRRIYQNLADAEEMTVILNTPPEIMDVPGAKVLKMTESKIEFKEVDFNYHETRQVLSKFNLMVKSHERLALVGPSGAGKTTIIRLLLRLHDLTGGKILIDNQNIAKVTQESLWSAVSLVPQDPVLFHRTIMENIRYGRNEASDEQVYEAARHARCHDFILQLPEGYNTYGGERGVKLSGGERQRVAIARAILRGAPILVLDEATSSLDSESELLIQEALDNLMKNKTVIVIAHRLSTIMKMDRIVVVDEGGIKEEGTHSELLKKKEGVYKNLWSIQAGGFIK